MSFPNSTSRISFSSILVIAFLSVPSTLLGFDGWSDSVNDAGQCAACHGAFQEGEYESFAEGITWSDSLHDAHLNNTDIEDDQDGKQDCDNCHGGVNTSGRQVRLANSGSAKDGVNAIGCMGCHGRLEDGPGQFGDGLRAHHMASDSYVNWPGGIPGGLNCAICHASDTTPASEDTPPPWFASVTNTSIMKSMAPCSVDGEEDYSSDGTGLDNDGDLDYDALEDSDCALPPQVPRCSASPFPVICSMPDVSGNGLPDVGVGIEGSVNVHIRDGITDAVVNDIGFGDDPGYAVEVIADINGNGAPEIAILSLRASGQAVVTVRDSLDDTLINTIFYGTAYAPLDMAVLPDSDGNGAAELAVLGVDGSGGVRVQARDALTDAATSGCAGYPGHQW
jgi:hypothetical protein